MILDYSRVPKTREELASRIDHTILKPSKTINDVKEGVKAYLKYGFRALVIHPWALEYVESRNIRLATVAGFPLGNTPIKVKLEECKYALENGASEVDVVVNLSAVKSGLWNIVEKEISEITKLVHDYNGVVKYILETSILNPNEYCKVAELVIKCKGDFVKTNTGFGARGVTIDDVVILRSTVKGKAKIKASGGVRTAIQAIMLIAAGADVIGTSSGVEIIEGFDKAVEILGLRE